METKIIVKIVGYDNPDTAKSIVRKAVRDDNGRLSIFGLGDDGEWVYKDEGEMYPDNCILPVKVHTE